MRVTPLSIPDVIVLEPDAYGDERGFFYESYNCQKFTLATGREEKFVQDNHSQSALGVLRGLHYQIERPQAKLVRVASGAVFDVAVDLRKSSRSFGCWVGALLSADNRKQMWIPEGFAHGFLVVSPSADFLYKTSDFYFPEHERCIRWDDPDLKIDWQFSGVPALSAKDAVGARFARAEVFE